MKEKEMKRTKILILFYTAWVSNDHLNTGVT